MSGAHCRQTDAEAVLPHSNRYTAKPLIPTSCDVRVALTREGGFVIIINSQASRCCQIRSRDSCQSNEKRPIQPESVHKQTREFIFDNKLNMIQINKLSWSLIQFDRNFSTI